MGAAHVCGDKVAPDGRCLECGEYTGRSTLDETPPAGERAPHGGALLAAVLSGVAGELAGELGAHAPAPYGELLTALGLVEREVAEYRAAQSHTDQAIDLVVGAVGELSERVGRLELAYRRLARRAYPEALSEAAPAENPAGGAPERPQEPAGETEPGRGPGQESGAPGGA